MPATMPVGTWAEATPAMTVPTSAPAMMDLTMALSKTVATLQVVGRLFLHNQMPLQPTCVWPALGLVQDQITSVRVDQTMKRQWRPSVVFGVRSQSVGVQVPPRGLHVGRPKSDIFADHKSRSLLADRKAPILVTQRACAGLSRAGRLVRTRIPECSAHCRSARDQHQPSVPTVLWCGPCL